MALSKRVMLSTGQVADYWVVHSVRWRAKRVVEVVMAGYLDAAARAAGFEFIGEACRTVPLDIPAPHGGPPAEDIYAAVRAADPFFGDAVDLL